MWIKRAVRVVCLVPSALLDWCKNTVDGYRSFVTRIADHLTMAGRENQLEVAAMANSGAPLHVDCSGKRVELREFLKVLNVGDRVRVFCDDGILVAEKVSKTQLKLIHAEMLAEMVH